jgi:nucleotidyltransferase/DNA polymerase involved in DNA repair
MKKQSASNDLTQIPYVGNSTANDLKSIGIKKISDLKGKNPEELYSQICAKQGYQIDRCLLYVCRSSVYFAENKNPDPEKLKWWNWKDKKI